jgi:hypothetical protein
MQIPVQYFDYATEVSFQILPFHLPNIHEPEWFSQYSTWLWGRVAEVRFPARAKDFPIFQCPNWKWGAPASYSMGTGENKAAGTLS